MGLLSVKKGKSLRENYVLTDTDTLEPFNVTGWSLRGTIREYPGADTVLYEWDSTNTELINGQATILIDEVESATFTWVLAYYDVELYSTDDVVEVDSGRIYAGYEITT